MANMNITVCDSCHELGKETQAWAIHGPEGSRKIDLCEKHTRELEDFLTGLAPGGKVSKARRTTRRQVKPREDRFDARVTTIEELQAKAK